MAASKIFICYRRADSADYASALRRKIDEQLPAHGVFMDLAIAPGERFVDRLKEAIATCRVLLVVIGPRWLEMTDGHGNRRLENPRDYVRVEIATALERHDLVVIPVLVGGATMPADDELPEELRPLVAVTASIIRDDRWGDGPRDEDVEVLVAVLRRWLGGPSKTPVRAAVAWTAGALASTARALRRLPFWARLGTAALVVLVIAGAVLALARSPEQPTVRIGVVHSLNTDGGDAVREARAGIRYAIDYINTTDGPALGLPLRHGGGLPGVDGGSRVDLVTEDVTSRDIGQARCDVRRAVRRLASSGVAGVIGAYESTQTLQAIFEADRIKIPLITDASSATPLTSGDFRSKVPTRCGEVERDVTPSRWFNRVGPSDAQSSELFAQIIQEKLGKGSAVTRVAILHANHNIVGNAAASDAARALDGLSRVNVKQFSYDPTTAPRDGSDCVLGYVPELKQRVGEIKTWDARIVIAVGYSTQAVATLQAIRDIDYEPDALLAFGAGFARPEFPDLAKVPNDDCDLPAADADGIITRAAFSPLVAESMADEAARYFKTKYKLEMTGIAALAFTATMTLAQAIDDAGSTDRSAVASALRTLRVPSVQTILLGGISLDGNGQNQEAGRVLLQIRSGKYVPVYPARLAGGVEPVWPLRDRSG